MFYEAGHCSGEFNTEPEVEVWVLVFPAREPQDGGRGRKEGKLSSFGIL